MTTAQSDKLDAFAIDMILYHGNCPDGIAACWVFKRANMDAECIGLKHGQEPPNVAGKRVVMVDFSFPREIIEKLHAEAKTLLVLDHHISAQRNLEGLDYCIFDMKRSGCQMAWDYYVERNSGWSLEGPKKHERPWFIDMIADGDLWKWEIPNSKFYTRALQSRGYYTVTNLEILYLDTVINTVFTESLKKNIMEQLLAYGKAIIDHEMHEIAAMCKLAVLVRYNGVATERNPDGKYLVKLIENTSPMLASALGEALADDSCDFSAMYKYDIVKNEWNIALRATRAYIDLPKITGLQDNSGGHAKASGFIIKCSKGESLNTVFHVVSQ